MKAHPDAREGSTEKWLGLACLALACWVAHFLFAGRMGLYEDDYIYTLGCFDWSWRQVWDEVVRAFTDPVQGRPLNHAFRRALNFVTLRGDTLAWGHSASWALLTANAYLLTRLVRRHTGAAAALMAGLIYLLYPADCSRQILMHQSDLLFGALLCLLGLTAFAAGRNRLGWVAGLCCLLNYESFYLPLLVGPLLAWENTGGSRRVLRHLLCFALLAGAVAGMRMLVGDTRISGLGAEPDAVILRSLKSLVVGPWSSLKAMLLTPLDALTGAERNEWLGIVATLGLVSLSLFLLTRKAGGKVPVRQPGALALAGLIAWGASYALCIRPDNFPPVTLIGRLSGVHAAGAIGCAMLAGAALELALARWQAARRRLALLGLCTLLLALFAGHGVQIQRDEYVRHWEAQGRFWRQVLPLVADLREGEPVLLDTDGPEQAFPITPGFPRFGLVNYSPVVLHRVVDYPGEWKAVPRVFGLWEGCEVSESKDALILRTPPWFWDGLWPEVREGAFIYLRARGDTLERVTGPVTIAGKTLNARGQEEGVERMKPNRRFRMLFGDK